MAYGFSAPKLSGRPDGAERLATETSDMSSTAETIAEASPFEELRPPLTRREAVLEADRCLECGGAHAPAPCTVACPAGVDVAGFIAALAEDDRARAADTIFAENLLGASCARVCPVEVLCEGACVLRHEGRDPIQIAALQRHAADWSLAENRPLRRCAPATGKRVVVIGAGPAGLACAGELAARGHQVTIYEERDEVGGLVRYAIAPYRIQRHPLPAEATALGQLGVEFRLGAPVRDRDVLEGIAAEADAVFLGVGMGADTDARFPGDGLPGVWDSLPFIEAVKSDEPPAVGRSVVVIGGGNTAIDVAREALRLGAGDVTLVYRRGEQEMPAYAHEVEEAREEGVRFQLLAAPVRFLGRHHLVGVECRTMRLGEPDASGRRRPEPVSGSEFTIRAETAVKAIGQRGHDELGGLVDGLRLERGRIAVDEHGRTSNPKFFAGGDAVNGGSSAVEAVREAKLAAWAIDEALR
jgi:dihydropyrimidine dehydrogenase (NAD+) subunit PreT